MVRLLWKHGSKIDDEQAETDYLTRSTLGEVGGLGLLGGLGVLADNIELITTVLQFLYMYIWYQQT